MDIKKYTEANRIAWNEVTPYHQKAKCGLRSAIRGGEVKAAPFKGKSRCERFQYIMASHLCSEC